MPVSTADLAPNVPQELIIDVLLRLPAKSVGKFRCISKSWRSLLSDPVFIKAHLDLHLHHPQKFILSSSPPTKKSTLSTLSFNPTGSFDNDGVSKKLRLLENKLIGATIVGSCNGLVLVSKFKRRSPDTKYYLMNPTTMELVGIPANPLAPWARRGGIALVVAFTGYSTEVSMMNRGFYMDVWMMMEYGVQESWTKYRPNTHPDTCLSLPVCLLGDDDLVLHVHQSLHKLVVDSLTGETKRDMLVTGIGNAFRDVKGFCESLVSPIFYSQKWNQHKLGV
nr:putative F-box protein At1g47790 [Coffea arabica]